MMMRGMLIAGFAALVGGGVLADAERAFRRGDYARAAEGYRRALADGDSSAAVRYNLGTALLRMGRHDEARPHLDAAARARAHGDIRFRASYNAGNTDLQPAAAGQVPPAQRRERLLRAIQRYRAALLLNPEDADAKWNLELAMRLLREESGGGGGGEQNPSPSGGGGQNSPSPATPQQQPAGGEGAGRPMTREQAERILAGAEAREQRIQRQQLKQDQTRINGVRDW